MSKRSGAKPSTVQARWSGGLPGATAVPTTRKPAQHFPSHTECSTALAVPRLPSLAAAPTQGGDRRASPALAVAAAHCCADKPTCHSPCQSIHEAPNQPRGMLCCTLLQLPARGRDRATSRYRPPTAADHARCSAPQRRRTTARMRRTQQGAQSSGVVGRPKRARCAAGSERTACKSARRTQLAQPGAPPARASAFRSIRRRVAVWKLRVRFAFPRTGMPAQG